MVAACPPASLAPTISSMDGFWRSVLDGGKGSQKDLELATVFFKKLNSLSLSDSDYWNFLDYYF